MASLETEGVFLSASRSKSSHADDENLRKATQRLENIERSNGKDSKEKTSRTEKSQRGHGEVRGGELSPLENLGRTSSFWMRAASIYADYKITQMRAVMLSRLGWAKERVEKEVWDVQHQQAAEKMYRLCVDLRGFYLKSGQFLGARGDFVPEQICRKLSLLHDRVPPMPPSQAREVIEQELGGTPLEEVFEWIDLDCPLGSASISQVHKAKLRRMPRSRRRRGWRPLEFFLPFFRPAVLAGDLGQQGKERSGRYAAAAQDGSKQGKSRQNRGNVLLTPMKAPPVDLELAWQGAPRDGVVAIKVQVRILQKQNDGEVRLRKRERESEGGEGGRERRYSFPLSY